MEEGFAAVALRRDGRKWAGIAAGFLRVSLRKLGVGWTF